MIETNIKIEKRNFIIKNQQTSGISAKPFHYFDSFRQNLISFPQFNLKPPDSGGKAVPIGQPVSAKFSRGTGP